MKTDSSIKWTIFLAMPLAALAASAQIIPTVELKPAALEAWTEYERLTEKRIAGELESSERFLVQDFLPDGEAARCRETLASGDVFIRKMETRNEEGKPIAVREGMIHHWFGSIFLPGVNLGKLLRWVQDYDQHAKYFDEVEESRLLQRDGDVFKTSLKLRRKKVITVQYRTEHVVEYRRHGDTRASSKSAATRIAQLENSGTPDEREKPPGRDSGFLWRLNSYWRFEQRDGGVVVSCESVSLSRAIPRGLEWLIGGYVESVPKESLEKTLRSIREGFHGRTKASLPKSTSDDKVEHDPAGRSRG
jgi:hypothetical protein